MKARDKGRKVLATNRKARHAYEILERFEAGIELLGTEVKAVRAGKINLKEGHVAFEGGEAFLVGCHISPYEHAGYSVHEPLRRRRLLLHKREILRLAGKVQEKGYTVVPLSVYLEGNWIKVEIALARGKHLHDKRETLRRRTLDREAEQAIKERY
ncbi:MAG TPA: SsrA-binding protein SmpB [Acidobacteria bacterium]|nr:SsrA-binding protein SmpB [Acidobacteriota bacterium]